ncbi:MAG: OmpA family protein [Burkholderiales bacterium]|nr:OmpA family protein [Burkholderiales bacterium]
MKPSPLPIAILVAIVAAILWWFWPRDKPAQAGSESAKQLASAPAPAPKAEPAPPPSPPAPKVEEPLTVVVYFDFDRSALKSDEAPKLDAFLGKLKDRKYAKLNAVGHADRIGEAPHNDQLSRKRADVVVAYLASKGADAARNHTDAKGESQSATGDACKGMGAESASNARLVDCLAKDRRVEIALAD